jgi:hemolysin activation/secretion protein
LVDATIDTRLDPVFPSDAVYATARIEQLRFAARSVTRRAIDLRGYAGLWGSAVLAVRAAHVRASSALPPYEQVLIGGVSSLRGYAAGHAAGDNLTSASLELRLPVNSPLSVGRMGVKTFVDAATVYAAGTGLRGQRFARGAGAGVFVSIAMVHAGIDVAWPLDAEGRRPRWHAALGVAF